MHPGNLVFAEIDEGGLACRRFRLVAGARQGKAENGIRLRQLPGKQLIVIGQCLDLLAQTTRQMPQIGDGRRRCAVGFGEHDIESDGRDSGLGQAVVQPGEAGARPGPLTEACQALLIDVDDPHRHLDIGARLPALILIENGVADDLQRCIGVRMEDDDHDDGSEREEKYPAGYAFHRENLMGSVIWLIIVSSL